MIVVGLTGGIGAGKSTFAARLAALGAEVVDVDGIGRAVIAPGTPGADAVAREFGTTDRRELAAQVFADPSARKRLEAISWPRIEDELRRLVGAADDAGTELLVLDMAVLPQGLGKGIYGPVVTVEAPADVRLRRLIERGMDPADARARMEAQTSEAERRALADHVVDNDGTVGALDDAARAILRSIAS
jgi:dephospho-CoA kinase